MRVLILGAGGFLGTRLAAQLAGTAQLAGRAIDELVLFDLRAAPVPRGAACPITVLHGDLRDSAALDALFATRVDAVLHLAATLTVDAESAFRRGLDTNVLAFIALLERCRLQAQTGPQAHKTVAELLLADHSRHGFVDGRALRLPIVVTHPGPASGSISDQVAALIREPLRGQPTTCRIAPGSRLVTASVDKVIDGFLRLAALPASALHSGRTMNLPGLAVTPAEIVQAVARHLPADQGPTVDWTPDARVQQIVDGWPQSFTSARALALGFTPDASADALVQSLLAQERSLP
jgi:nucleoside-diphosphate-sugar epimerase